MKSYIQGLITGGVFVFTIFVLIGATESSAVGTYQIATESDNDTNWIYETILDTRTGDVIKREKYKNYIKIKKKK